VKLVLFDIDGTLLWTDGAGRRAIHTALVEVFGTTGPEGHWFDGKTDPQIVRELMGLAGIGSDVIEERIDRLLARYVEELRLELSAPDHVPHVFPGVRELLDALENRNDVTLGLLTGNLAEGAREKLRSVGLDPSRFSVGAFGSDHHDRPELPAVAQRRFEELFGRRLAGRDVVVIGDTPADVTCGRAIGARAIGVATGRYSIEALLEHGAHAVFEDLRDTARILTAIVE
jgi:phosphoglycolate phosphatase-like HAD superfamily hydrolase